MSARAHGLGRVYKRGNIWWVQYNYRGTTHRESSHSRNRNDAVKLLRRRHSEMGRGRLVGPDSERLTFDDLAQMLIDDYKLNGRRSVTRAQSSITRLHEFFGFYKALDITSDRIAAYISDRQETGMRPATIRNELAALKRMFSLAQQAGKLSHRPHIPSIEVRNTRTGFFEEPEFRAVHAELPVYLKPVMRFAYLTGWRARSEVLPLAWRQVDFTAGTVRLEPGTTKNAEGRTFPFGVYPDLEELLREQRERTAALEKATGQIITWVFHHDGKPIKHYRGAWKGACERAGLSGMWVHDFRRTAVRNLERAGVSRSVAMKLTGHKTEAVYRRYAIVVEADLREGVQKLATLHASDRAAPNTVLPLGRSGTKVAQFRHSGPKAGSGGRK